MTDAPLSRREFLRVSSTLTLLAALPTAAQGAARGATKHDHPAPRPGITAERVLAPERFHDAKARRAYAAAREIPDVLDGLYCVCGCREGMGHRSLLACYETKQPSGCPGCQDEALLALRLHQDGKSLDEIRTAVDKEF
jgi:hypothetical protein